MVSHVSVKISRVEAHQWPDTSEALKWRPFCCSLWGSSKPGSLQPTSPSNIKHQGLLDNVQEADQETGWSIVPRIVQIVCYFHSLQLEGPKSQWSRGPAGFKWVACLVLLGVPRTIKVVCSYFGKGILKHVVNIIHYSLSDISLKGEKMGTARLLLLHLVLVPTQPVQLSSFLSLNLEKSERPSKETVSGWLPRQMAWFWDGNVHAHSF